MISVALCTYNGAAYIEEQLKSVITQTRMPDELIVCDDCSTDETIEIIRNFAAEAPFPVKLFVNDVNLGSTKNFEKAILLCMGDIIFLSDQDDRWLPQKIEVIENEFRDFPNALLIFTNGILIDEKGKKLPHTLWEKWDFKESKKKRWKNNLSAFTDLLYNGNKVTGATAAIKKELAEISFPVEPHFGHLHDAWLALIAAGKEGLHFIDYSLIEYRIHNLQQIGIGNGTKVNPANSQTLVSRMEFENRLLSLFPEKKELIRPNFFSKLKRIPKKISDLLFVK